MYNNHPVNTSAAQTHRSSVSPCDASAIERKSKRQKISESNHIAVGRIEPSSDYLTQKTSVGSQQTLLQPSSSDSVDAARITEKTKEHDRKDYGKIVSGLMRSHQENEKVRFVSEALAWHAPGSFFTALEEPCSWKIHNHVKASDAIKAWFHSGETVAECGSFLVACQLDGLRHFLGDELFNAHFGDGTASSPATGLLEIKKDLYDIEFLRPFTNLDELSSGHALRVGQKAYIQNTPRYLYRHPEGIAQGENLIYLGRDRYSGFGLGAQTYKENEIKEILFNSFANPPTSNDRRFLQNHQQNLTGEYLQRFTSMQEQTHFVKERIINEMEVSAGLMIDPTHFC